MNQVTMCQDFRTKGPLLRGRDGLMSIAKVDDRGKFAAASARTSSPQL